MQSILVKQELHGIAGTETTRFINPIVFALIRNI
jgi:hypothetical protein